MDNFVKISETQTPVIVYGTQIGVLITETYFKRDFGNFDKVCEYNFSISTHLDTDLKRFVLAQLKERFVNCNTYDRPTLISNIYFSNSHNYNVDLIDSAYYQDYSTQIIENTYNFVLDTNEYIKSYTAKIDFWKKEERLVKVRFEG